MLYSVFTCSRQHPARVLLALVGAAFSLTLPCAKPGFGAGIAEQLPLEQVFEAERGLVLPVTPKPGEAALEFPAVRREEGQVLCVRFRAFLFMDRPGGWNPYLRLRLNGKPVQGYQPDGSERLLNRGQICKTTHSGPRGWWDGTENEALITFFGPGIGEMDSRLISARDEGYWYVLDVSDLANYVEIGADERVESDIPNELTFINTYAPLNAGETAPCREMHIEDVTVGFLPQEEVDKLQPITARTVPEITGETLRGPVGSLTVAASGAMELKVGRERYSFSSAYSYPGPTIGYHRFSWNAEPDWKLETPPQKQKGCISIRGESKSYTITRTVRSKGGKFRVADTIENKTDAPLGMSIRHSVVVPQRFGLGDVYFAGQPDRRTLDACATNPTVFLRQGGSSLGVVVEDNVLRLQLAMNTMGNSVQFGTEHFGLPARGKYTTEWTLYPSRSGDYFAFINRVRRDWKINLTVPGPFVFSDGDVIPGRKVKLYAVPPWFMYATGSGLSKEEFKETLQPKLTKLYSAQPDAVALGMIETNLIAVERQKLPGSEMLPPSSREAGRGAYGYQCTAEQTRLFEQMPWFDCMLKTADGRVLIDTYYPSKEFVHLMVYPAPRNYQLEYLLHEIDYLMDVVGFKGVYIDQFALAVRGLTQRDRRDFSKWDDHTVDLDEHGEIARMYTDAALVGAPARAAIIKHVNAKGGVVVTNGHSVARETTGLPCFNFQETEWVSFKPLDHLQDEPPVLGDMAAGHLDTPIALGIRPARFGDDGKEHWAEIIHKWVITGLKNGQLYYYYASVIPKEGPGSGEYGAINHMFPFTPVELHAGWLVGKERIITTVSGDFVWNRPHKPVCLLFDLKGRPKTPAVQMRQRRKAWDVSIKLSDWTEIAVIESAED